MAQSGTLLRQRDASQIWANLTGVTFEAVVQILSSHQSSSLRQTELFQTILSRDPDVIAAVQQRSLALLSAKWEIEYEKNLRGRLRDIYERFKAINWNPIISHLAMFPYFGYSAVHVVYDATNLPSEVVPIPHRAIDFRAGRAFLATVDGWRPIDEIPGYQFRIFTAKIDEIDPAGRAIMRPVAAAWVIKHYVLRDWAIYSERLGDPPIIGRYSQGVLLPESGKTVADYLSEQLQNLKNHAVGAFPDGVDIRVLADDRFDASRAFSLLVDTVDRSIKRAILTSEATIQTGGEGRGARASDQVRAAYGLDTIIEADARVVCDVLNSMLRATLILHGYDGSELFFKPVWIDELPTIKRIQAMYMLKRAGFAFDEARALREVGFEPVEQAGGVNVDVE